MDMALTASQKLERLVSSGSVFLDGSHARFLAGSAYPYSGRLSASLVQKRDEAFYLREGGSMTSTTQKLKDLTQSRDLVLAGEMGRRRT